MEGFEVLNTITNRINGISILGMIMFGLGSLSMIIIMTVFIKDKEYKGASFILIAAIVCGFACHAHYKALNLPDHYEVSLKFGTIIDATKWNVIEQRGEIYVIESRIQDK